MATILLILLYNMASISNKRYYKGISLFIKISILLFSIAYIVNKINASHVYTTFFNEQIHWNYFLIALLLVAINWGIEAYKWQFLIHKIEKITFSNAFKAVLSGVTIGIFTPNRIGEFAGRVFYLNSENKIQATLISFVGSAFQLLITIVVGFLSCFYVAFNSIKIKQTLLSLFTFNYFLIGILILLIIFVCLLYLKKRIIKKYKTYTETAFSYSFKELFKLFYLSLLRYIVFTIQYYLILKCFNIHLDFFLTFNLIALTFLVSSIVPSFAFTEMAIRGTSAIYFFGLYVNDTTLVLAASLIVWLINLAVPSLIGAFFIWKLKFFKE